MNFIWKKKTVEYINLFYASENNICNTIHTRFLPDNSSPEEGKDNVEQQRSPDHKVVYPCPVVCI